MLMAMKDVALSSGSACTSASLEPSYVLRALGADEALAHSSIRFGMGRFTTEEEVDFVTDKIVAIVKKLRDMSPLYEMVQEGAYSVKLVDRVANESHQALTSAPSIGLSTDSVRELVAGQCVYSACIGGYFICSPRCCHFRSQPNLLEHGSLATSRQGFSSAQWQHPSSWIRARQRVSTRMTR